MGRLLLPLLLVAALAAGCGSGSGGSALPPDQALAQAQQHLASTSGVRFTLFTEDLPEGVTALRKADGVLTSAPAYQGTITLPVMGFEAPIDVTAVDGKVWAKLPFTSSYQQIDPAKYGVPDPATLLDPTTGIASLLPVTTGATRGESHRGGDDNRSVITDYHGTVPGATVARLIPGATGDVDATYTIDDQGYLSQAVLTGRFNGQGHPANTYTVTVSDYGTQQQITAP